MRDDYQTPAARYAAWRAENKIKTGVNWDDAYSQHFLDKTNKLSKSRAVDKKPRERGEFNRKIRG